MAASPKAKRDGARGGVSTRSVVLGMLLFVVLMIYIGVHYSQPLIAKIKAWSDYSAEHPVEQAAILGTVAAATLACFLPFMPVFILNGTLLGLLNGALVNAAAYMVGSTVHFVLFRQCLRARVRHWLDDSDASTLRRLSKAVEREPAKFLLLIRFFPSPLWARTAVPAVLHVSGLLWALSCVPHCFYLASLGAWIGVLSSQAMGSDGSRSADTATSSIMALGVLSGFLISYFAYKELQRDPEDSEDRQRLDP